MSEPAGRLELTWANKHLRLLSHGESTYEWCEPDDYRVSEVRLIHEIEAVGEKSDNLLIHGDALHALTALTKLPAYAKRYAGKVKLCYIDPPFNTGQAFAQYDDALEHSVWLTMLRDRLAQIRELLTPDGSVWVHLDDAEIHRARCVLDEVFGMENFVATVVWQKTTSARNDTKGFSTDQDMILVYAKVQGRFAPNGLGRSAASEKAYSNPDNDPRGPWREGDYKTAKGSIYPITHPVTGATVLPPPGSCWRFSAETHKRNVADGLLWWGKTGNYTFPKVKRFRSGVGDSVVPQTLWLADAVDTTRRAKQEIKNLFPGKAPFDTPKPERLLQRVIHIATNPGDLVLDCFGGSGTTEAVAHKMGRRWVTVEQSADTIATFLKPRMTKVVAGTDTGGITKSVGWSGGGGFTVAEVGPSMFENIDGFVALAEHAAAGDLAEGVAAQLGYDFEPTAPFAGRKGRFRLAVIDGVLTRDLCRYLVEFLADDERLMAVAQAVEPGVEEYARELRSGSRVRKVPRDLARVSTRGSGVVKLAKAAEEVQP